MARLVNLNDVLSEPIDVELGDETYRLPGDIPIELYLEITSLADQKLTERELTSVMYEHILDLFRIHQPNIEHLPLSPRSLVDIIPALYGNEQKQDPAEPGPTTRKTRGASGATRKRPAARKKTSRS